MWRPSFYCLLFSVLFSSLIWAIPGGTNTMPILLPQWSEFAIFHLALFGFVATLYFSLRSFFKFSRFRIINIAFIAMSLLPICAAAYIANSAISTGLTFIYKPHLDNLRFLKSLSTDALSEYSDGNSMRSAKAAYVVYNTRLAYITSEGVLTAFTPSEDDILKRNELQQSQESAEKAEKHLTYLIQRTPSNVLKITIAASCYFLLLLIVDLVFSSTLLRERWSSVFKSNKANIE